MVQAALPVASPVVSLTCTFFYQSSIKNAHTVIAYGLPD